MQPLARLKVQRKPSSEANYPRRLESRHFAIICPVDGQLDIGSIELDYIPDVRLVHPKAFDSYLASFRTVELTREAVVNRILDDFMTACRPRDCALRARFKSRDGFRVTIEARQPPFFKTNGIRWNGSLSKI